MRRIKLIAEKTFRDPAIRLHCLPVPAERYGWTRRSIAPLVGNQGAAHLGVAGNGQDHRLPGAVFVGIIVTRPV